MNKNRHSKIPKDEVKSGIRSKDFKADPNQTTGRPVKPQTRSRRGIEPQVQMQPKASTRQAKLSRPELTNNVTGTDRFKQPQGDGEKACTDTMRSCSHSSGEPTDVKKSMSRHILESQQVREKLSPTTVDLPVLGDKRQATGNAETVQESQVSKNGSRNTCFKNALSQCDISGSGSQRNISNSRIQWGSCNTPLVASVRSSTFKFAVSSRSDRAMGSPCLDVKLCNSQELKKTLQNSQMTKSVQKTINITAPINNSIRTGVDRNPRKTRNLEQTSVNRIVCMKMQSSPGMTQTACPGTVTVKKDGSYLNDVRNVNNLQMVQPPSVVKVGLSAKNMSTTPTRIWLSPALQIDTKESDSSNGMEKNFSRAVLVCVLDSLFKPQRAQSSYPQAINAKLTYNPDGKVSVIESADRIGPGVYKVLTTKIVNPHVCLQAFLATEALLVSYASVFNLKPKSQFLVITEMYDVPRGQWRERISMTAVRMRFEDFLYTYNFRHFALPLLLWTEGVDKWSWARESARKFHAIRKRKRTVSKTKHNDSAAGSSIAANSTNNS